MTRKFMAIASVMGPSFTSTLRTSVTVKGAVTEKTWQEIEEALRNAPRVDIPRGGALILINLIELEG